MDSAGCRPGMRRTLRRRPGQWVATLVPLRPAGPTYRALPETGHKPSLGQMPTELSLEGEPVEGPEETQGMEEIEAS